MTKIFNGENTDITIVTDLGDTVIPAKEIVEVEIPETAVFGTDNFYVEEQGSWYSNRKGVHSCESGADMEIYNTY